MSLKTTSGRGALFVSTGSRTGDGAGASLFPGRTPLSSWGGLAWCAALVLAHWLTWREFAAFRVAGQFDSAAAAQGEWWRAFTAIALHADLAHLLANTTVGFLLFGLAMARYGAGLALCTAYLAGAAGNWAGLLLYPRPYFGLGASGMVMGALGLIAIPPFRNWSLHPQSVRQLLQALSASLLLFVLLGVDPASDVIAHLGGFVAGALVALALNLLPITLLKSSLLQRASWLAFGALFAVTAWLASTTVR